MISLSALRHVRNGLSAVFLTMQTAAAANGSWNVDANGSWITAGSWMTGVPGATSGTGSTDIATFGYAVTGIRTVTVDANRNIGGITFSDSSYNGFGYTLSGGSLLLSNGGIIQTTAENNDIDTISTAIVIQGNGGGATFRADSISSYNALSIGSVTGVSTAGNTTTLTLEGGSSADNIVTGIIGNGSGGGVMAVTKSGTGIWNLSGSNSFTGQLTVQSGFLKVASVNNASSAGVLGNSALSVMLGASGSTGTLEYTGASMSSNKKFTLGSGSIGAIQVDTTGTILTLSGVIDGSGALNTVAGYGTLILSGANTYTGGTNLYSGVLNLGSTGALGSSGAIGMFGGTLQFTSINKADYSSRLSLEPFQAYNFDTNGQTVTLASPLTSGGGSLNKIGTGTLTLTGANTYSNGTTVNAGTLAVSGSGTLGASSCPLTVDGTLAGVILNLGTTSQTVGDVYLLNGATISGSAGLGTLSGATFNVLSGSINAILAGPGSLTMSTTGTAVTLSGANTYSGGTTVYDGTLSLSGATATLGASSGSLTVDAAYSGTAILNLGTANPMLGVVSLANGGQIIGSGTLSATAFNVESGTISAKLAGTGNLIKTNSSGSVTLSGVNTYTGSTLVNAGTLQVTKVASLPGQTTFGLITVASGAVLAVNAGGSGEFAAADLANLLANANFAANSMLGLNTTVAVASSANFSGAFGISKFGAATLTLSGSNSYFGGTTISAGALALTGSGTLGAGTGALTVDGATASLSLGTTNQTAGVVSVRNGGQITGAGILTGTAFNVESSGNITAILAGPSAVLTKSSTGTVTLSGVNTYGGGTLVSDGTLTLSGTTATLGASSGALTVDAATSGSAIVNLGSTLQTVGAVSLLNGGQLTGTGPLTGTSFHVENGIVSVKLAGTGASLTKTNATGTVTLSGINTYTGTTQVNAGTLQVAKVLSLPGLTTPGLISVAGGATLAVNVSGTGEFTAANIASLLTNATFASNSILGIDTTNAIGGFNYTQNLTGALGLSKLGVGTLTLSGSGNTYSGGTLVSGGSLVIAATGSLGTGPGGLTADGATTVVDLGGTSQSVGAVRLLNGANIKNGTLTGTSFYVAKGSLSANLLGSGATLTKEALDTVTLTGANTYSGGVMLLDGVLVLGSSGALGSSGTISLAGTGTLQFTASNQTDYSSRFSTFFGQNYSFDTNGQAVTLAANLTSSLGTLTKAGLGTLTLSGNNTYSGITTITGGTLLATKAASLPGQGSSGQITVGDNATLAVNAGGNGEFAASNITSLMFSATFGNNSTLAIDTSNGSFAYPGALSQAINITKLGNNTLTLSGANSYSGTTVGRANGANAGTLLLSDAGTLGSAGPLAVYGGTIDLSTTTQVITTLTLGGGAALSSATISLGSGELQLGDNLTFLATNNPTGATITGTGGGKLSLFGDRTFKVGDSTAAVNDLTISAIIQNGDATARALTKTGTGTLLLSGSNTYTGTTTVSAGILQAAIPAALPGRTTSGKITVAGGATLAINVGGTGEFTSSDIATLNTNVNFAGTAILGLDTTNAVDGTFTAPNITGTRSVSKLGGGTLVFGGSGNTYNGTTLVSAGTLQVTGTLGTGGLVTIPTGGTMAIAAGSSVTRSVTVSGGALNLSGTMGSGSTLSVIDGTVNALGSAATAAIVILPLPTATTIFNAPTGQELIVTGKLTQTVSNGYYLFTAGSPAFKAGGNNLVTGTENLIVQGGTTKIERYVGNMPPGLEVRAWQGSTGTLEGALYDLPGSPTNSSTSGSLGYATNSIHTQAGDWFLDAGSGVTTGSPSGYTSSFTVEYRGKLHITTAGSYTFSLTSDDGSALWIDPGVTNPTLSAANINDDGSHGMAQVNSSPISLTVGDHDIIVRFFQGGGGQGLYVQWDPAGGTSFVDIPGANFVHGSQTLGVVSLPTTNLTATAASTVNLGLAGSASLGTLNLTGATAAMTFQTATSLSLDNISATDTSSIAGPALSLRSGNVTVADTKTLTVTPNLVNGTAATVLTKLGGGTLVLNGTNTYSGATTVNAGTLTLAGVSTLSGATVLNGGTLTVTNANALQNSNVTFNGGTLNTGALASVPLGGITAGVDTTVSSVLSTIAGYPTWAAADGTTLTIGGAITRSPGAAINFGSTGTITGAALGTLLGTNTITPWATSGGTDWALYDGSKIVPYTAYTAAGAIATAPVIASAPTANYRLDNTTTNNATLATTGTIDINTLAINDPLARAIDVRNGATLGTLRLGTAGAILLAGGSQTIGLSATPGTLTAGGASSNTAGDLAVMTVSNSTINSLIADNGTGKLSLTKYGSATLTLTAANTFTGVATVASGTLSLSRVGGTLADTAPVSVAGGTLALAQADTVGLVTLSSGTISGVGILTGSSYAVTDSGIVSAVLAGSGGLLKTGAGTVTLSGSNTYTGLTEVQAGTLTLGNASNTIANTAPVTVSGGILNVASPDTVGVVTLSSGTISGTAALTGSSYLLTNTGTVSAILAGASITLTKTGAGTVVLSGNNTYTGLTDVQAGTLSLARVGGTLANAAAVSVSGGTLDVAQADTLGAVTLASGTISGAGILTAASYALTNTGTISAVLAGAVSLTKTGAGTAVLTATNTYTGATTVTGGTLSLGHSSNTIANTSAVSVSGGTLDVANPDIVGAVTLSSGTISGAAALTGSSYSLTNTGTISAVLAGTGALSKSGVGTASLSAVNTYSGVTTVSAGVLRLDSANALPGGIATTGGTGGLTFSGGVIGLNNSNFTRNLNVAGTVGAATFTGAGGWAAYGADRVVNLGGAAALVTWATAGTGLNSQALILGASTATHMVDFQNPIDLGAAVRTVQVDDGAAATDAKITGILSGVGGGLTKTGAGTLVLTAAESYTGATTVGGGTLALDFSVNNPASVLSSSTALTLTGGTLSVTGKATGTTTQAFAGLTLSVGGTAGRSAMLVNANGGGGTLVTLGAITHSAGYIDFTLPSGTQSATNGITTSTAVVNGILGNWATVGSNWASLNATNIVALGTYTDITALGATIVTSAPPTLTNVRLNSAGSGTNIALGAATTTINTLLQNTTTAAIVDTAAKTLQTSGIMLASGQGALTLGTAANSGFLSSAAAGGELVLINNNSASNLTINAVIQNNTTASPLATMGSGNVVLNGAETYSGVTTVGGGRLTIGSTGMINTTSAVSIRGGEFNYNSTTALSPLISFTGVGGTLSGSGTLSQLVTVPTGNTLAPGTPLALGTPVGILSFGNSLTLAGTYAAQLGTPGALATPANGLSDRAAITGNLILTGGILSLSDNAGAGSQGSAGAGAYRLMTFTGTRTGTFDSVINPLSAALHESVVYNLASAGSVDLLLYRLAAANTLTTPLNLGTFHLGAASPGTALSLTNTAASDGFSEKLTASIGSATGDAVVSGAFTQLAAQGTNNTSLRANITVATVGNKSGTAALTLSSDGTATSGYAITSIATQTLTLTGTVYSGLMAWSGVSGGAWSTNANWNDAQAASVHAAPGLDAGYTAVDTATFGTTSGSVTVNLNGAAPSLNALSFNNTGTYTIAQGSGSTGITLAGTAPTITVAGSQTINAPLALASNATITTTSLSDNLTVSGVVSGSGMNLMKNGAGTLNLNAANTYTGTTTVAAGTLAIGAVGSLATSTLTVQSGATLAGSGSIGGSTTLQGIEAPGGTGIAIQTFTNSLALAATSHLQWQLSDNLTTGRGTAFDGVNVSGGTFAITPGATIDLSFGGAVNFTNSFWTSNQSWNVVDLLSGVSGTGGTDLFTLGSIGGGSYSSALGTFSIARVADASSKQDVVLQWTAATGTASPYQTWIDSYSASIPNAAERLPGADPDHDATTNLAEFAFDGLPNVASSRGLFFTTLKDNNADGQKELTFTCAVRRSAIAFAANANNAQTAIIDGVTYTIEGSATLTGTWNSTVTYIGKSDTAPAGSGLPSLAATNWEYRTFSAFNGLAGKGFLRANVAMDSTTTATPYQTWIDSYSASIPNAAERLPGADPDHDGTTNLAEFAFDGAPNVASSKGLFFTTLKDNNADSKKELTFTCAVRRSTSVNFSADTNGAQTATIDGVSYTIEGSATLTGTWNSPVAYIGKSDTAPVGSGLPSLAATNWEYRTFSGFNGLAGKGFLRAKLTQP